MVRLVFVDVDGTLVGREGVPPCVWPEVEALKALGVRFALVTGRPGRGEALLLARRLAPTGLHVYESGAVVLALEEDPHEPPARPFHVEALPEEAAREAVRLARRLALPLEGYTADGGFFVEGDSPLLEAHKPPWSGFWRRFPGGFRPTWRKAPRCRGSASSPSPRRA